jgi:hypothetical protein
LLFTFATFVVISAQANVTMPVIFGDHMVLAVTQTPLSKIALCIWVLCTHIILGGFLAYTGCRHSRWE